MIALRALRRGGVGRHSFPDHVSAMRSAYLAIHFIGDEAQNKVVVGTPSFLVVAPSQAE